MTKYGVDKNGYIITEVSYELIKPSFKKLLSEISNDILALFKDKTHSFYCYGSVATGKARFKSSDLDLLLVLKRKPSLKTKAAIKHIGEEGTKKYKDIFRDVGIALTYTNEARNDLYGWGCFIKHLSVCIYGDDLGKGIAKFKPSKEIAKAFNGDIETHIENVLINLKTANTEANIETMCSSIMRKIVRTGFCLVLEKEMSWTTDLNKSCEIFSRYYPEQASNMKMALEMAKKPINDRQVLIKFLSGFGAWLGKEANTIFH